MAGVPRMSHVSNKERLITACVLAIICALVGIDLFNDFGEGVAAWHVTLEAGAAMSALIGLFYLLRGAVSLRHRLGEEIARSSAYRQEAEAWRAQARQYVAGLAVAIDQQLARWNLTNAEKDVAFLLLKGYGLKEIALLRHTSEKTARAQSASIYSKAGLSGRSELAAFFLEDLLVPPGASASQ
jgi:DNA-binding CsgD family transcriptional regulator